MPDHPAYPKRPAVFAIHFARLLIDADVPKELGAQATWLLTAVVLLEDKFRYTRSVQFFNKDLAQQIGLSVDSLDRIRQKCIDAGWLVYTSGYVSRSSGLYHVTIPPDCSPPTLRMGAECDAECSPPTLRMGAECDAECSPPTLRMGAEPSYLKTPCIPADSTPSLPAEIKTVSDSEQDTPARGPNPEEVVAYWNSFPQLLRATDSHPGRDTMIRSWATLNPKWVANWRKAIAFMARTDFYCGGGPRGWRATLYNVLKEDKFAEIVERMEAESTNRANTNESARRGNSRSGHLVPSEPGKYARPDADAGIQTRRPAPGPARPSDSPAVARGDPPGPAPAAA